MNIILTFSSIHHALSAEKVFIAEGLSHEVMPTPRSINMSCGLSLKVAGENVSRVQTLLVEGHIQVAAAYVEPEVRGGPYRPLSLERS